MTIAESLKRFRTDFKLTQLQVAEKLGILQQTYYKYESGKVTPSAEFVLGLANAYDVTTDYLLGRSNTPRPVPADKTLAMEINNCRDALQKILSIADKVSSQGATAQ